MRNNQIPGDINVVGTGAELREHGSSNIIDAAQASSFFELYNTSSLLSAYYCDFTTKYPFEINQTETEVASDSTGVLYPAVNNLLVDYQHRSFDTTEDAELLSGTKKGKIVTILPWILCVDETGLETSAYSIKLYQTSIPISDTGAISPDTSYGYTQTTTCTFGSPTTENARYKLEITAVSGIVIVKAFGLLYDVEIL